MSKWETVHRCSYYDDDFNSITAEIDYAPSYGYCWRTRFSADGACYDGESGTCATLEEAKAACDASVMKNKAKFAERTGLDEDEIES